MLTAGNRVGHYEILAPIGAGGMGEVYRARDTKLNREVAIKLLPEAFATDPDRMARFKREAQVLASLNHPNIAAIYGVEECALVMELVEGPTLSQQIAGGPIPLEEAAPAIAQLIDALEFAHEKGVVHRDLKPANIKITPAGRLKVLDFGLAKAISSDSPSADPTTSSTLTMRATMAGTIMGTAAYMAPEQARGHEVDKRADIWSFGVVVYEMLTGSQLFGGPTVSDTLAAVLKETPDLSRVPASARRLLRWCLEKDPKRRLRDIGDSRELLQEAPPAPAAKPGKLPWAITGAAVLIAIAASLAWRASRPAERPLQPLVRLDVDLGPDVSLDLAGGPAVILSPDNTRMAYVSRQRLYVRRLDQPHAVELAGTEGAQNPFFSPDGQWLAFFARGQLKKIPVEGGAAIALCNAANGPLISGAWGEDGTILAMLNFPAGLFRIPLAGSPAPIPPHPGDKQELWPQFLPGGKAAFVSSGDVSNLTRIDVLSLSDGKRKTILEGTGFARYVPSGHVLYLDPVNRGNLLALPFDLERAEPHGKPVPVAQGVAWRVVGGAAQFDFSPNGTLVYQSGDSALVSIQWINATGTTEPAVSKPANYFRPRLSPDGMRLAIGAGEFLTHLDVFVYDLSNGRENQLTFDGNVNGPIWTPDGRYIVAGRNRGGGMVWMRSDGASTPQPIFADNHRRQGPFSFTRDQKRLAFMETEDDTARKYHLWTAPVETDATGLHFGKAEPFSHTPGADERHPAFSPDGHWLAYTSTETGVTQIWVRPFPGSASSGRWQVSKNGGTYPQWTQDGRHLFFRTGENKVMVADCTMNKDTFASANVHAWSATPLADIGPQANFDVAPDGKRVIGILPGRQDGQTPKHQVVFLLNFFDELRRRVPVEKN